MGLGVARQQAEALPPLKKGGQGGFPVLQATLRIPVKVAFLS